MINKDDIQIGSIIYYRNYADECIYGIVTGEVKQWNGSIEIEVRWLREQQGHYKRIKSFYTRNQLERHLESPDNRWKVI